DFSISRIRSEAHRGEKLLDKQVLAWHRQVQPAGGEKKRRRKRAADKKPPVQAVGRDVRETAKAGGGIRLPDIHGASCGGEAVPVPLQPERACGGGDAGADGGGPGQCAGDSRRGGRA